MYWTRWLCQGIRGLRQARKTKNSNKSDGKNSFKKTQKTGHNKTRNLNFEIIRPPKYLQVLQASRGQLKGLYNTRIVRSNDPQ